MELLAAQLWSSILLFIGTFIFGLLPVFCFRYGPSRRGRGNGRTNAAASYLVNFGGGVFLCLALMHLLPKARDEISADSEFEDINVTGTNGAGHRPHFHSPSESSGHHHNHHHSLPLAEFTMGCGFFLAYIVDIILQVLLNRKKSSRTELTSEIRARFCSCSMRNIECSRPYKHKPVTPHPAALSERRRRSATWDGALMAPYSKGVLINKPDEISQMLSPPDILQSSFISHPQPNYGTVDPTAPLLASPHPMLQDNHGRLIHGEGGITIATRAVAVPPHLPNIPEGELPGSTSIMTSPISLGCILIVLAISIPSVIEGMAIGFQQTPEETWSLFLATAIPKLVVSFIIGVIAFSSESKISLTTICMAIFSIMSPTGIVIVMLSGINGVSCLVAGIFDSLAAGAILYIVFYELWPKQPPNNACNHSRFVVRLFGLVSMIALQYAATLL